MRRMVFSIATIGLLSGCTTASVSNARMVQYDSNTRYAVEPIEQGFRLTVDYGRYQFIPETDAILIACKSALTSIAYEVARMDSRIIKSINEQEIRISSGRNGLTGVTSCQASVPVYFSD